MTQGNEIIALTIIPTLWFFFRGLLTGGHWVGAIDYYIGGRIGKMNIWLLALIISPLLMTILPEKSPCTLPIISRGPQLVILVFAGHGGCFQIFGVWYNRILSNPLRKLICGLLGWDPTRAISLWPAVFLDMAPFATLVTSYIWPDR